LNSRLSCYRSSSCNHGGTSLVLAVELLPVLRGLALVLELGRHRRGAGSTHGCQLCRLRSYVNAATSAIVGDAVVVVVDDDRAIVDVGDPGNIDTVDRAVVIEVVPLPVAAVIAASCVSEAIVDATVEADMQPPEAAVEAIAVTVKAPVAGRPESSVVRRSAPCAGHPVIACGSIAPIARCPKVVGLRRLGLLVHG